MKHYIELDQEAPAEIADFPEPNYPTWPANNPKVEFVDVRLRYREELEGALLGLTFTINPFEKIAICGRTGNCKLASAPC